MNNDIILQSLKESFEILKDSWETRIAALKNCIVETEKYDGALAMDMWLFILHDCKKKSENSIIPIDKIKPVIRGIFYQFIDKYYGVGNYGWVDCCECFSEHIVQHIVGKEEFIKIIMEESYNAAYSAYDDDGELKDFFYIPQFIASLFFLNNSRVTKLVIQSLSNNKYLIHTNIGAIIRKTIEIILYVLSRSTKYHLTEDNKMMLLSCMDMLKQDEDKAECTIAILSLP